VDPESICLGKLEELCRPRGSRLVAATQYEVLTQGNMELLEYIEKCREVKETCGWPQEEKNMALRNEILVGLKTPLGYQKGLGEYQNMLATERVIEIATDIYNSDCQKSIEQTLSTVSTAVAAIQQRSSEVQKLHANQQDDKETVKGQDREERYFEKKGRKEQGRSERQNCLVAELNLPIPHLSVQPEKSYVKSVEKKGTTRSVANPSTNQLKFISSKFFVSILHPGAALT
ncbi:unnamed protein product, partial [Pocillopora meandrina]